VYQKTYLYSTNGTSVDDSHAVILQEVIDALSLETRLSDGYVMNNNQIKQLCAIIEAVGFANPAVGNVFADKNGKLWLIGQQPNTSRPQDFFYCNDQSYHHNIVQGYTNAECGLRKTFSVNPRTRNPETWRAIIDYARESDTFHASNFTEKYREEMCALIQEQENQ